MKRSRKSSINVHPTISPTTENVRDCHVTINESEENVKAVFEVVKAVNVALEVLRQSIGALNRGVTFGGTANIGRDMTITSNKGTKVLCE